jgi:H+-translocating NAD(P) transhydrogenase subunit alpha
MEAYVEAGASIGDPLTADVVFGVNAPSREQLDGLREGVTVISLMAPMFDPDLVADLAKRPITAMAMDAVPRISRAQSLDVLSSMANIAGYRAVVEAAHEFGRFFTGQVTAAGKVPPAKVLVAGAASPVWRRSEPRGAWGRSCTRPTRVLRSPTRSSRSVASI